ncbi:unnamed protein product, partial [Effrenium voratum]
RLWLHSKTVLFLRTKHLFRSRGLSMSRAATPASRSSRRYSNPYQDDGEDLLAPGINPKIWGVPAVQVIEDPYSKATVTQSVELDGRALIHAVPALKNDKEVALKAVRADGSALMFVSDELKRDKEVVLEAVRADGDALRFADQQLLGDKDIALAAVQRNGRALQHVAVELRDDEDVCLAAVQQVGRSLRYASQKQQANKLVVDAAVENSTDALPYAAEELKQEWEEELTRRWKAQGLHLDRRKAGEIVNQIK